MKNHIQQDLIELENLIISGGPIGNEQILTLIEGKLSELTFDEYNFKKFINRIYEVNDGFLKNKSEASSGIMGFMNRIGKYYKNKRFRKLIVNKKFNRKDFKLVIAEGDSWFEYPLLLKDVLDWLPKIRKDLVVYSLAFGGDWLSNIIYEGKYIEELTQYHPEFFLIGGGGNDLVGSSRVARLINKEATAKEPINPYKSDAYIEFTEQKRNTIVKSVKDGLPYLNPSFYSLLNQFRLQYIILFKRLKKKFPDMKILTHGYDFPIPNNNRLHLFRFLTGNGKWLYYPLLHKGITDHTIQRNILYAMIHEFNEMLIDVARIYENVIHIDNRGFIADDGWFDELHPRSKYFREISLRFIDCMKK